MKKTLLKIAIVLIIILAVNTSCIQATTNYTTFGISPQRTDETDTYVYTFQSSSKDSNSLKYIWNIKPYTNQTPIETDEVFYCLAQGYGNFSDFDSSAQVGQKPATTGGASTSEYKAYNLKASGVLEALRVVYSGKSEVIAFNENTIHGLVWILDNMYIPGEDDKDNFLEKINCTNLGDINGMSGTIKSSMDELKVRGTNAEITDFDIEVAQQLAIWNLTNHSAFENSEGDSVGIPTIYLSKNSSDLKTYDLTFPENLEDEDIDQSQGKLRGYYVKMVYKYFVDGAKDAQEKSYALNADSKTVITVYANAEAQPIVTVTREKELTGEYDIILKKEGTDGTPLSGAEFTVNGQKYTTTADGTVKVDSVTINNITDTDEYTIVETKAPEGYKKYKGTIELHVTKKESDDRLSYVIDQATLDDTSSSSGKVEIDTETNTITITVKNEEKKNAYTVRLNKQNTKGEVLQGATFTVDGQNYTTDQYGFATLVEDKEINSSNVGEKDTYTLTEIDAPDGYVIYDGTIVLEVTKKLSADGESYVLGTVTLDEKSKASGKVKIEIDEDTITVIVIEDNIDLSLRKFISKVVNTKGEMVYTNEQLENRNPNVDTTNLKQATGTTSEYNHTKEPLKVSVGDKVTYTLRVYNEGQSNAYITEITDYLSKYLKCIETEEWNVTYTENDESIYGSKATSTITGASDDLKALIGKTISGGVLIPAYDKENDRISYIDVQITCEVLQPEMNNNEKEYKITNIAEITGMLDKDQNPVDTDIDSKPDDVTPDLPKTEKDWQDYKDDEIGEKDYIPGNEDDDDFEKVIITSPKFDLALRKFITKINTTDVTTRYPELSLDDSGNIKYTHPKDPLDVCTGDIVTYTIRIYNEGEIDGYADEITDDVPFGLQFVVDNEINQQYRWKMLDENQQETTDVSKAKYLVTDYLSEEQEKATGRNNLIKAYNKETGISDTNPDYRDVQIAFKVTYQVKAVGEESRILVNVAQISKDSDDDIDSVPKRDEVYNDEKHEDDIDYEDVKVKYFDLSLLKWVTKAIVTENGNTTVIESGHTGYENPEPELKVELKTKDVSKVVVKFAYKIKITNEGEIAGYAKEITDYIPAGLEFKQEDNPAWYVRADGKVATTQLQDVLLQPGESAEVEIILTWKNGENNLGRKVNVAEISQDDNPSHTPDIDSTPDNEVPGEDDIDDAPVLLVIKTGIDIQKQYLGLTATVIAILGTGIIGIKKFVL